MRGRARGWGVVAVLGLAGCAGPPELEDDAAVAIPAAVTELSPPVPSHPPSEARIEAVPKAREIGLRRDWHAGDPVYEAIIDARGEVWYHGEPGAARVGVHTGHVTAAAVHQALRKALDGGFMDEPEYDPSSGDHQTVFTSVALERRRTIIGHGGALAASIDDLLAQAAWDAAPRVDPPDPAACPALARAIAGRCGEFLRLKETAGDCGYWLALSDSLVERNGPDPTVPQRCARYLLSLQRSEREAAPRPVPRLSPRCRKWHAQTKEGCLEFLDKGMFPYACGTGFIHTTHLSEILQREAAKQPVGESSATWCDDHVGGYAR